MNDIIQPGQKNGKEPHPKVDSEMRDINQRDINQKDTNQKDTNQKDTPINARISMLVGGGANEEVMDQARSTLERFI